MTPYTAHIKSLFKSFPVVGFFPLTSQKRLSNAQPQMLKNSLATQKYCKTLCYKTMENLIIYLFIYFKLLQINPFLFWVYHCPGILSPPGEGTV